MSQSFSIPADFRAFMRDVVGKLDWEDAVHLSGPEALQHACGRGGLVERDLFRFTYLEPGGHGRWLLELHPQQIRDIACGLLEEIEAVQLAQGTRNTRGDALLVWGEYDEDALRVRTITDLGVALDALAAVGLQLPCLVRLWSSGDDQAVVALAGWECAIYIVQSSHGYGRSVGDANRTGGFDLDDHHLGSISVAFADCVPWRVARPALLRFAESGELGDGIELDGSIPSQLLMLGDYDRDAELAQRRQPAADPALSSLPRKAPHGDWAQRLVRSFLDLRLIEVDIQILDAIIARVAMLLVQFGDDALDSPDAAQQLVNELERVRGIGALYATGGDLQIALRRTQDPPTMPIEIPMS